VHRNRKFDPERRAAVIPVRGPYQPLVRLDGWCARSTAHPHAFRLAVKNGSKIFLQFVFGNARPAIDTDSSANFPTREVRMLMIRFSAGVSFIASMLFTTRFRMTC